VSHRQAIRPQADYRLRGAARRRPRQPPVRRGSGEEVHDNAVRSLPEERAAEIAARTLALPDARSVEDLTALLTSAGER